MEGVESGVSAVSAVEWSGVEWSGVQRSAVKSTPLLCALNCKGCWGQDPTYIPCTSNFNRNAGRKIENTGSNPGPDGVRSSFAKLQMGTQLFW